MLAKALEEGKDLRPLLEQASAVHGNSLTTESSNIWLRTIKANKPDMMMNNISIYIGHGDAARTDDLAKGAGGDYRFLDWTRNMTATKFITEFSLWRQSIPQGAPPAGWDGITGDINAGRGGDNLYLIWKSDVYTGSK
ncbi:hypothetical protein J7337_007410 [Fusarium musae]|uniref:Uncharacterized protein n=1 Tax=Fusarium musae TaxID=1042133 RepID=A0A9P8DGY9_9HYPO|nr:hypothetical protein J7337_007410 [Fusarium musae]KAG9501719.1 hypothetical protein J7337_007410 [Fusarium musae]